jgi:Cdc6-like AAA superfamily ATPase
MDPKKNPFSPGAGYPPPELAGRAHLLERADITLARLMENRPAKGLLLIGLRGVGKTVLLNRI